MLASSIVRGQLMTTIGDENRQMHVTAHSRQGDLVESAPVTSDGKFSMNSLQDGVYSLTVVGSRAWTFAPMHVHVDQGAVVSKELRINPLEIPGMIVEAVPTNVSHPLVIDTFGKANYLRKTEPWSISAILGNKFLLLQIGAVIFVIMFPRYLKTLDRETLAELTGEVEPDAGDPNKIIKALVGRNNVDVENEIVPAIPFSSI